MIADRLLARLRGLVGYAPSAWSLVRILCFTLLGLLVISLVVPYKPGELISPWNRVRGTDHSHVVSLQLGDTRGYAPAAPPGSYRIAWIGGSEILGVRPRHQSIIPGRVNDRIHAVDGKRPATDVYFQNAMRLADELSSLHRALASKPDLVVVSLNPVWVLNDLGVQQWGYMDGLLARGSVWPPSDWPVAASLVSPGDVGWKGLSSLFGSIDDRLYWGTKLTEKTADLSFLDKVAKGVEPAPTGLGLLGLRRPVDFWQEKYGGVPASAPVDTKQLSVLQRGVRSKSSINVEVLRAMFAAVRRAGVKAYFYVPPISPKFYARPDGKKAIEELRSQLVDATKGQTTSKVLFDPQGLQDRVRPTIYKDIVHKLNPDPEIRVLTGDLCKLIAMGGHTTKCEKP
ncbi:hypothetical protein [Marmoricola sp. URHB0036]|uniref:hypothetical protein n=1 Tax=Marmoricola sp. URHB0036 TaxID=1298863 RepID=UPI0003F852F0|nr:hypothetical protein [Marmoricola sp. URHB0036]